MGWFNHHLELFELRFSQQPWKWKMTLFGDKPLIFRLAPFFTSMIMWGKSNPECLNFFENGYMGVSKNSATPKWMVYNGKPYEN